MKEWGGGEYDMAEIAALPDEATGANADDRQDEAQARE